MLRLRVWLAAAVLVACAGAPPPPMAGTGTLFGDVRLTPRQGVTPPPATRSGGGYDDPRLRGVRLVDYSRPGFAVVYLDGVAPGQSSAAIAIRTTALGVRLDPAGVALGATGKLRLANETREPHIVSLPRSGEVQELRPGERLEVELADPGPHPIYLLDLEAEAVAFAAPGPFSVVDSAGGWQLKNLAPGPATLRTFHPRFPSAAQQVRIAAGERQRVDLEIGVDLIGGEHHADH
jgi:hypothetical protein